MVNLSDFFKKLDAVNLLPRDYFEKSVFGRVMEWTLGFGKWIVIITQLVVVGAFLMRFGLDRKLTNIRRKMEEEIATIESYADLENKFVLAQKRIAFIAPVIKRQDVMISITDTLARSTPIDVWYDRISIGPDTVSLSGNANSIAGFGNFLSAIRSSGFFDSIGIGNIESGVAKGSQIKFEVSLSYSELGI